MNYSHRNVACLEAKLVTHWGYMMLNFKLAKYAYKTVEERRTSTTSGVARGKEKDVGSRRGHKCATDTHSPPLEPNDKQKEKTKAAATAATDETERS